MAAPKGNCFNPKGRPQKEINWDEFEQMCAWHCTQYEIASFLKMHPDTLRDHAIEHYQEDFSSLYKRYEACGKCSLKRSQYKMADTNPTMSIWLGKQYLGQRETPLENIISEQIAKPFEAIMSLLTNLQSSTRKDADTNSNTDTKSA